MKIELYFTYAGITEEDLKGRTVVVIDVLRASTVACAAFAGGCKEIIPVETVGDGTNLRGNLDKEVVLLAGERGGYRVDGFDLGNSPLEFTERAVKGKTIILASTNGSKAMLTGSEGGECLVGCFVNLSNAVSRIRSLENDVAILCAGTKLKFSLEDTVCGGMIVDRLLETADPANNAAVVALELYRKYEPDMMSAMMESDHGKFLTSIGFAADLGFASRVDTIPIVPNWDDGRLIAQASA
jgi:2-phosphosulfolactate phosphatase